MILVSVENCGKQFFTLQTDGSWSIRMENVVSTITFKADIYSMVSLTITAPQNGTLTVKLGDTVLTDGAKLAAGDILTIAADPATGYTLDKLTVSGATKQPGGTYKVDAAAVSVSASFKSTGGTSGGGGGGGGNHNNNGGGGGDGNGCGCLIAIAVVVVLILIVLGG